MYVEYYLVYCMYCVAYVNLYLAKLPSVSPPPLPLAIPPIECSRKKRAGGVGAESQTVLTPVPDGGNFFSTTFFLGLGYNLG